MKRETNHVHLALCGDVEGNPGPGLNISEDCANNIYNQVGEIIDNGPSNFR